MNTTAAEFNIKRAEALADYIINNNIQKENDLPRRELSQLNYLRGLYREEGGQTVSHAIPEMEKNAHHMFINKLDRMVAYLNKAFERDHPAAASVFTRPELKRGASGLHALRPIRDNMYQVYTWGTQNFGNLQTFMDSASPQDLKDSYKLMDRWLNGMIGNGIGDYDGLVDALGEELPEPPGIVSESLVGAEYNSELFNKEEKAEIFRESLREVFNRLGYYG